MMMETGEIIARANEAVQEIYGKMGRIESCEAALKALDGAEVYIGKNKTEILDLHSALNDDQIADIMAYIHTTIKTQIEKEAGELNMLCSYSKEKEAADINSLQEQIESLPVCVDAGRSVQEQPCDDTPEKQRKLEKLTMELFGDKNTGETVKAEAAAPETDTQDIHEGVEISEDLEAAAQKSPKACKSTLPPDEEEKLLRRLYVTEGRTVKEIADIMGLTKANIYDRIKKYGLRNKRYDREWDGFAFESARRN